MNSACQYKKYIHIYHMMLLFNLLFSGKRHVINNVMTTCYITFSAGTSNVMMKSVSTLQIFTCVALAKAGLVVGPLRPSFRSFVCSSVGLSIRNTFGFLVCVICNYNSFHSFIFKLCLMIVHTLKMCTFYFVHI